MVKVKFKYRDQFCRDGKWSEQECTTESVQKCIEWYGLDQPDVEYEIVSVEKL